MDLRKIRPGSIALLVAGAVVFSVGACTGNGGFPLAGGIFPLAGLVPAFSRART